MRLFAAIRLPDECRPPVAKASQVLDGAMCILPGGKMHQTSSRGSMLMGARLVAPENWHFTLLFMGEADEAGAAKIEEALSKVEFAPFPVRLFGAGAYPSESYPRAICIGGESAGAEGLAKKVRDALSSLSLRDERFSVHLTVARSKGIADVEDFIKNTGDVCEFEARSFVLMRSILGAQGATYQVLREFNAQG